MAHDGFGVLVAIIGFGNCRMTWRRAGADRFLPFDTREEIIYSSLVVLRRRENIVEKRTGGRAAPTTVNSLVRTREYLTGREVERLMAAARKGSRWGHRDATMILIGYRHGLRASELCDLQWISGRAVDGSTACPQG